MCVPTKEELMRNRRIDVGEFFNTSKKLKTRKNKRKRLQLSKTFTSSQCKIMQLLAYCNTVCAWYIIVYHIAQPICYK